MYSCKIPDTILFNGFEYEIGNNFLWIIHIFVRLKPSKYNIIVCEFTSKPGTILRLIQVSVLKMDLDFR